MHKVNYDYLEEQPNSEVSRKEVPVGKITGRQQVREKLSIQRRYNIAEKRSMPTEPAVKYTDQDSRVITQSLGVPDGYLLIHQEQKKSLEGWQNRKRREIGYGRNDKELFRLIQDDLFLSGSLYLCNVDQEVAQTINRGIDFHHQPLLGVITQLLFISALARAIGFEKALVRLVQTMQSVGYQIKEGDSLSITATCCNGAVAWATEIFDRDCRLICKV